MKRLQMILLSLITGILALIIIWLAYILVSAYRAVPELDGEYFLEGIAGTVTIYRDNHGIPIIEAKSEADAYFGLGYTHAQDRFFAMELMRRQGQGRLAELIGPIAVNADKYTRTLGLYKSAQEDLKGLHPDVLRISESYAAGVNAWIKSGNPLPVEFKILMFEPEPWTPADSLVWQKIMGLQLSGNWDDELVDALLIKKLGPTKAQELWPVQRADDHTTLRQHALDYGELPFAELLDDLTSVLRPTLASNVWTLKGERTDSNAPILASDPHLGFQAPNLWYLAGINYPGHRIFGATVPGVPFHIIGQNDYVAWGLTTTHSDTGDLFIEKLSADNITYETPDGPAQFHTRTETISVRFNDPVHLTVRNSRHGPIVSDILSVEKSIPELSESDKVVALAVNVLQPNDKTAEGAYRMARAKNVYDFADALKMFHAPQQNFVFADSNDEIGFFAPGRVPIRKSGDGTVPVPGWGGEYDWKGWIPYDELPQIFNPPSGTLINANNKIVTDDYKHLIAARWRAPFRANRISELLNRFDRANASDFEKIQVDQVSIMAREMAPLLLKHLSPEIRRKDPLLEMLETWNGSMDRKMAEPLILILWIEKLKAAIAEDELDEVFPYLSGVRAEFIRTVLIDNHHWCDDINTPEKETCNQQVEIAWNGVQEWMKLNAGSEPASLKWGDLHLATFDHLLFGRVPLLSGLGKMTVANGGDNYTINVGSHASSTASIPFRQGHGPAVRAIFDLSDRTNSRFALAGGQSGHLASTHYDDLLISWRDGQYLRAPTEKTAVNRLILNPTR